MLSTTFLKSRGIESVTDLCRTISYCIFQSWDPVTYYKQISTEFLRGFLSWVYDQRRGKGGRRRPGFKYESLLETFWK